MYKPDTVTLFTDYHMFKINVHQAFMKAFHFSKSSLYLKALLVKVDTMLTHIQIKMQLG